MESERLWVKLIKRNKIAKDLLVQITSGDWSGALSEACYKLDLSVPLVIDSHKKDWQEFNLARFMPDDFMDAFDYDRMEIEGISDESRPMSKDPRNA
ncbi:MAG: hypothetical protein Q4E07_04125 [Eubacteriales bacterium]|nr:hypothetical protein [Eubacteriales bacterium]